MQHVEMNSAIISDKLNHDQNFEKLFTLYLINQNCSTIEVH